MKIFVEWAKRTSSQTHPLVFVVFVFLSIWWVKLFQRIFIVRSYKLSQVIGEGWDPANMFNPATFCMYVPVLSQESVIQWLSFVYVLHIFVFHSFFVHKLGHSLLVCIVLQCHFKAFYRWLCGMAFAHCWRLYGDHSC